MTCLHLDSYGNKYEFEYCSHVSDCVPMCYTYGDIRVQSKCSFTQTTSICIITHMMFVHPPIKVLLHTN